MKNDDTLILDGKISLFYSGEDFFLKSLAVDFLPLHDTQTAYTTGASSPYFNLLCVHHPDPPTLLSLEQARSFYKARSCPWSLVMPKGMICQDVEKILKDFGLKKDRQSLIMIKRLTTCTANRAPSPIKTKNCQPDTWIETFIHAFDVPQNASWQYAQAHKRALDKRTSFYYYSVYKDLVPVGSSCLSVHKGVALIDDLGILPAYQKQGYGDSLLKHVLQKALEHGAHYCVLDALDQGKRLYEKNGFNPLCQRQYYLYDL